MKAKASAAPTFPAWAPREVIHMTEEPHHYRADDPRRESPALLVRLLVTQDMKRVWDALANKLAHHVVPLPVLFAANAASAFCGPRGEAGLTPAQHRKFVADVRKCSGQLAALLRGTDLDRALITRLDLYRSEAGHAVWSRFSELLKGVDLVARLSAAPSVGKRTHGDDARRAYFVRQLTGFFTEYLGGPRRELVAIATAAAFEDPSFTVRQVQRLAPRGDTSRGK